LDQRLSAPAIFGRLGVPARAADFELVACEHCGRQSLVDLWPMLLAWQKDLANQGHKLAERPGVLHSFEGSLEQAQAAMASHFLLGITGPVTFKNAEDRQALVRQLPLDSLVVETDSPYLTPHPFRGQRNEPAHVLLVAEKIAELHSVNVEEVAAVTSANADRLFSWRAKD
jgi:TatD DNase family protein